MILKAVNLSLDSSLYTKNRTYNGMTQIFAIFNYTKYMENCI